MRLKVGWLTIVLLLLVSGCQGAKEEQHLFDYKDAYVGDNSAISHIVSQLYGHEDFQQFELQTTKKPYGITLFYKQMERNETEQTLITNAAFLFVLIQNVDVIHFQFGHDSYTVTRVQMQSLFEKELRQYDSEDEVQMLIERILQSPDQITTLLE